MLQGYETESGEHAIISLIILVVFFFLSLSSFEPDLSQSKTYIYPHTKEVKAEVCWPEECGLSDSGLGGGWGRGWLAPALRHWGDRVEIQSGLEVAALGLVVTDR